MSKSIMSKSILHNKADGTCYLCMKLHGDYARRTVLEEHHCMKGNQYRHLAEKYGLKVYLCPRHHRGSEEAPHDIPTKNGWRSSAAILFKSFWDSSHRNCKHGTGER